MKLVSTLDDMNTLDDVMIGELREKTIDNEFNSHRPPRIYYHGIPSLDTCSIGLRAKEEKDEKKKKNEFTCSILLSQEGCDIWPIF